MATLLVDVDGAVYSGFVEEVPLSLILSLIVAARLVGIWQEHNNRLGHTDR
jgi:hypothetical protein